MAPDFSHDLVSDVHSVRGQILYPLTHSSKQAFRSRQDTKGNSYAFIFIRAGGFYCIGLTASFAL